VRAGRSPSTRRIAFDAEQELRTDKDSFERLFDAGVESALGPSGVVDGQQRLKICVVHGPSIRATGQRRQDLLRATPFLCPVPG